jgi:hypothetical protein
MELDTTDQDVRHYFRYNSRQDDFKAVMKGRDNHRRSTRRGGCPTGVHLVEDPDHDDDDADDDDDDVLLQSICYNVKMYQSPSRTSVPIVSRLPFHWYAEGFMMSL